MAPDIGCKEHMVAKLTKTAACVKDSVLWKGGGPFLFSLSFHQHVQSPDWQSMVAYQRKAPHDCPGTHQTQEAIRTNMSVAAGFVPKTSEVCVTLIYTVLGRFGYLSHLPVQRALRVPAMKHGFFWLLKWQHNSSAVSSASPLEHIRQQVSSFDLKIRMKYLINLKSILLGCLSGC